MKTLDYQDKIKVVIVDDEPQSVLRLQTDLTARGDFEVVASSSSAMSAKTLVLSMQPDVLFIDVEMPGKTGFEVLQSLRDEMPSHLIVVFYSAFDKYMIDALRASAFDFLLKPYQQEELDVVAGRIRQKMAGKSEEKSSESGAATQDLLKVDDFVGKTNKRLAVQTITGLLMVRPEDMFCCVFDEDCRLWSVRLTNGQVYKLKKQTTAKNILTLSPSLAQVRQDCIINLDYLISIENYTLRCIFAPPFEQEDITVSRRCYKAVKEQLEIL